MAAAGIWNAGQIEQRLQRTILALATMQSDENDLGVAMRSEGAHRGRKCFR